MFRITPKEATPGTDSRDFQTSSIPAYEVSTTLETTSIQSYKRFYMHYVKLYTWSNTSGTRKEISKPQPTLIITKEKRERLVTITN